MWTWEIDWGDHHVPEVAGERVIDCEAGDHSAVIPCHFSVFLGVTLKKKLLQLREAFKKKKRNKCYISRRNVTNVTFFFIF